MYNASRFMLKLGEHTWGLAGNCVDNIHWTNDQFDKMIKDPGLYSFVYFLLNGIQCEGHSNYNYKPALSKHLRDNQNLLA